MMRGARGLRRRWPVPAGLQARAGSFPLAALRHGGSLHKVTGEVTSTSIKHQIHLGVYITDAP